MIDYFAHLVSSGHSLVDLERFYRAVGRLDTLAHVTQVAEEARLLAARFDADSAAAELAALAHDLASVVPAEEMPTVAERLGAEVSAADRAMPALLHGPIAAAALTSRLSVDDEAVLDAVRYHTTLRAGAGTLEKIVFVADKLAYDPRSPHRGEYVPTLRTADSLDDAALMYLDFLLDNARRYGWTVHPRAIAAHRDLVGRTSR